MTADDISRMRSESKALASRVVDRMEDSINEAAERLSRISSGNAVDMEFLDRISKLEHLHQPD